MGVSRGSFYWHFADVDAFHAAILRHWREVAAERIIANVEAASNSENPVALLLRQAFGCLSQAVAHVSGHRLRSTNTRSVTNDNPPFTMRTNPAIPFPQTLRLSSSLTLLPLSHA